MKRLTFIVALLAFALTASAQPIKKSVVAGQPLTLDLGTSAAWTIPGRDSRTGSKVDVTYESAGVRKITAVVEYEVTVTPPVATKPPTPAPPGVIVGTAGDLNSAVKSGGTFLFARGNIYVGNISIKKPTSLVAWGDPSKPLPIIRGTISATNVTGAITLDGIDVDGTGIKNPGLLAFHCQGELKVLNSKIRNCDDFGMLVVCESRAKRLNVLVDSSLIYNNSGGGKESGMHFVCVDSGTIRRSVIDTNGWRPGKYGSNVYSHGDYTHGSCGPFTYEDNVLANNSANGLQARSGGDVRRNLFIDNPCQLNFGYVDGDVIFPGGVSGEITGNVFIGGRDITDGPSAGKRGWPILFGNVKAATLADNIIAHDNQGTEQAVVLRSCPNIKGAAKDVGIQSLTFGVNYVLDWPKGFLDNLGFKLLGTPVGTALPASVNLRNALGADFMTRARANPASAAKDGLAKIKAAAGI